MRPESLKYLLDIHRAASLLTEFTIGKRLADYERDAMLRAAVEREFEIIGEAVGRLARSNAGLVNRISEYERIIGFRNLLIHGYADVDDSLVWAIVQTRLPTLRREVDSLLNQFPGTAF